MSGGAGDEEARRIGEQFRALRQEEQRIGQKLSEIETEHREHQLVLDTLKDMNGDRKCFRLIGGVLTERTVEDVQPEVKANQERIEQVLNELRTTLEKKSRERETFQRRHNIRIQPSGAGAGASGGGAPAQAGASDGRGRAAAGGGGADRASQGAGVLV